MRSKRIAFVVLGLVVAMQLWDLTRPPEDQLSAWLLLGGIGLYRGFVSPWIGSVGVVCRFEPSCSRYAEVSIRKHGAAAGMWRSMLRLGRCGPWTPAGTVDPP